MKEKMVSVTIRISEKDKIAMMDMAAEARTSMTDLIRKKVLEKNLDKAEIARGLSRLQFAIDKENKAEMKEELKELWLLLK